MELFKAHKQWATRPDDERFPTVQALYDATQAYAQDAREKTVPWSEIRTEAVSDDVQITGKANVLATLTHWAFGQLCARLGAPAEYIRRLPATLACQNLNYGLAHTAPEGNANLLFHTNGGLLTRAITSEKYARIWNYEVAERLLELAAMGWEPATPDTNFAPPIGTFNPPESLKKTAPYASDHDMFAFLRSTQNVIREVGSQEPLYRGVIVENSEVGAAALKLTRFLYRFLCGNHIIWGAQKVIDLSLRHVGNVRERIYLWNAELRKYAEESASDEEAKIAAAKRMQIAATKDEVLDKLFGMRSLNLGRKVLEASYNAIRPEQDGDPKTVWGMVQGITRYSQTIPYADRRTDLDRAAGKLLEVTF